MASGLGSSLLGHFIWPEPASICGTLERVLAHLHVHGVQTLHLCVHPEAGAGSPQTCSSCSACKFLFRWLMTLTYHLKKPSGLLTDLLVILGRAGLTSILILSTALSDHLITFPISISLFFFLKLQRNTIVLLFD